MSGHHEMSFPKQALWGASALVLLALAATIAVRVGLLPQIADPQTMRADANVTSLQQRDLIFADRADGAVVVTELSGETVAVIMPNSEQGFVRGLMRGLARERRLREASMTQPFRLQLWSDNGLTLTDLATGRQIELGSFGPTNRAAFAVMLPAAGAGA
ncbi:MAG: photosynthetic complex assembly protein PuhC [Sandaracinobacteroides sp.]